MSHHDRVQGYILIASDVDVAYEKLKEEFRGHRVVGFIREKFLIEDAKAVIAEAYISEADVKYIILGAYEFNSVSQNALLKVLEEPPRNIEFILISPTKSALLPTVRSRLPMRQGEVTHNVEELSINLARIDYAQVFAFLKEHARMKRVEAKALVEALYYRATVIDKLILNAQQLENFEKAYRLLELNARAQSVLAMLLMSFVQER